MKPRKPAPWQPRLSHDWVRTAEGVVTCTACKATKTFVTQDGEMTPVGLVVSSVCPVRTERAKRR